MKMLWLLLIPAILMVRAVDADQAGEFKAAPLISLTEADNGKIIELKLGQRMAVALSSNPTTGYSWKNIATDGDIIVAVGEPVYTTDPTCGQRPGCGGAQTFQFKAVKPGTGHIKLVYQRPWERVEPTRIFEVTVNVG